MKYYYTNAKNEPTGPVAFEELEALAKQGVIRDITSVIPVGSQTWTTFEAIKSAQKPAESVPSASPTASAPAPIAVATPEPAPAQSASLKLPANTVMGEFVEVLLRKLRGFISADLLMRILGGCKMVGHWAVLGGAALVLLVAIFWAIKNNEFNVLMGGLIFVIAIALGQFAAIRFLDAGDRLLASSPTRMTAPAFPDCLALIWLLVGLGSLITGIRTSIRLEDVTPLIPLLIVTLMSWIAAAAALNPRTMNVETEGGTGGEEAVGLIGFLPKIALRMVPAFFALFSIAGVVALLLSFSERTSQTVAVIGDLAPGIDLVRALGANAGAIATGGALLVVACFIPIATYVSFVITYLTIDLIRAILSIPGKLDNLRR